MQHDPEKRPVRFGAFEADLHEGRLTKSGARIRLQEQPFQILALLLSRPGELVSREEIRKKLWSHDTFVEFDDALNTAVRKLRAALNDSADNPRFLETIPRRGYRFIAPVILPAATQPLAPAGSSPVAGDPVSASLQPSGIGPTIVLPARRIPILWLALVLIVGVILTGGIWYHRRAAFRITSRSTVVLADFVNTTGEPVFDDGLREGLEVGLEQSPLIQVLPDRKAAVIMKQMGHSPDERMTGRKALEVCQRAGGKVTVQGSVSSLGTAYLIGLAAIRCDNGEPIVNEQIQANRKEDVVNALGRDAAKLRARLGESLPSIQRYNAPLEQATTPSLDALYAYGMGLSTWDRSGDRDSLPFFQKAVKLDPNFAMAYSGLATIYYNLGETDLANEDATKAFELRDRVTQAEQVTIEARYYSYVTGDLEKTEQVYLLAVQDHPDSPNALNHLGDVEEHLGRYESSADNFRKALHLDPSRANTYANLAGDLLALDRPEEAAGVLADADNRKLRTEALLQLNYWLAFLRGDDAAMQRQLQLASDASGALPLLLSEQSNTEAYFGHLEKARKLSEAAANLMEREGNNESAADCFTQAAIREVEIGNPSRAREFLLQAQKLSEDRGVIALSAIVMAGTGDEKQAEAFSKELDKRWPAATFVQKYWLPVIRAEIDLENGRASKAVEDLRPAAPWELAPTQALPVATIYPAYVRGQAYLAEDDTNHAIAEFQKFTAHSGLVLNFPFGALARLGVARAYSRAGNTEKARQAYSDFLLLWKDADPGIPIFVHAKAEYAKLH